MDTNLPRKPATMAELLPGLGGILSKDAMQTLTAKKQPRSNITATRTSEKVLKPMTVAEMRSALLVLKVKSPRTLPQGTASAVKKWNSSCKVENKTVSLTANGQMKHNSVRKALNFQPPKPKVPITSKIPNARMTINTETPKFQKPIVKPKKSLYVPARNPVRISGVCQISATPLLPNGTVKSRLTIANKENISNQPAKVTGQTPKSSLRKRILASQIPDTPLSNVSWKSSCDASFLQNEKDIEFIENKNKALTEEGTLDNIAEVSPPVSTPFKEYRNVKEFFNNSSGGLDKSEYQDNTIMCFEKTVHKENSKREDSVIVSLCDMLNKATVSHTTQKISTELHDLLEVEKQTENNLKMTEIGIQTLNNLKQSQLESLRYVRKLISEKEKERTSESEKNKTIAKPTEVTPTKVEVVPLKSPIAGRPCSVIKSCLKSPSYKIPKKNRPCMGRKVFYKSMPNVNMEISPVKDMGDKALSMYLNMKEHMNFLNTPVSKQKSTAIPDTPAITSHNLQKQLDKLFGDG